MPDAAPAPTAVTVRRMFTAPVEKVYAAWTEPEKLGRWFLRGTDEFTTTIHAYELRPGGRIAVDTQKPGDKLYKLRGEFREIEPLERLVFSWSWEGMPEFGDSLVNVEFHKRGNFTELVLTHSGFPTAEAAKGHNEGWVACFHQLDRILG
jgi:uncharacterized protein YndB with AHSA1/START domain